MKHENYYVPDQQESTVKVLKTRKQFLQSLLYFDSLRSFETGLYCWFTDGRRKKKVMAVPLRQGGGEGPGTKERKDFLKKKRSDGHWGKALIAWPFKKRTFLWLSWAPPDHWLDVDPHPCVQFDPLAPNSWTLFVVNLTILQPYHLSTLLSLNLTICQPNIYQP